MRTLHHSRLAIFAASAALALLTGAKARAEQAYGNYLPPPVAEWLDHARQDCPAGFAAHDPIQTVDLTGEGRPGYIADPHRLTCAGEPHLFIGDGPASIELFVTLSSGEVVHTGGVLAFGYQVLPSSGGPPTIAFQTQGIGGGPGVVDDYRWNGRNFAVLNRAATAVPPPSYDAPQGAYAPPAPAYGQPPQTAYGAPPPYAPQQPNYGPAPSQTYAPPPNYGNAPAYGPPPAYAQPPGYAPPPSYPPSPGYQ